MNSTPKVTKETKNKIKVDFDRTPLKERLKAKFLNFYFFQTVVIKIFRFIFLLGIAYVVLFPFFSKIAGSFMAPEDFIDVTVRLIPKNFSLDIYKAVWTDLDYLEALINTVLISGGLAVIQTFVCCFIAEIEARKQICEVVDLLRNNSEAFKNCIISSVATQIGVRESRKLKGEHILTVEELFDRVMFDDSIALGNYDVDIHNPAGTGTVMIKFDRRYYYSIPYRSLLPKEFDNLLVAGRCISATHEAQSSVRIMPICACLGEAAGTAIGLAKNTGLNTHTIDVKALQKLLTDNGAQIY